jgi:nitrite reductase/ring-hydroxylating ferredoxin subunit
MADGSHAIRDDFIPADCYVSPQNAQLEKERLWPQIWQIACRLEEIPNVGDFVVYDICDDSIIIVRSKPDEIKAHYNVCTHRGRKLTDLKRGHVSNFWCRYHGWKFALDGASTYVHSESDWNGCGEGFRDEIALRAVKCDTWAGWVWIHQDPNSEPLRAWLGEAATALDPFGFEDCRRKFWKTLIAPVNWKVVVEAFNEGYHSYATHHSGIDYGTVNSPGRAVGRHGMFWSAPHALTRYRDAAGQWRDATSAAEAIYHHNAFLFRTLGALVLEPGMSAAERLVREVPDDADPAEISARYFALEREETEARGAKWPAELTPEAAAAAGTDWHIFPNTICLPSIDGALWYRLRPNGDDPDSCIFDIWSLGRWAPGAEPKVEQEIYPGFDAFRGQCPFLEEDFANMAAVHQGMKCRGWAGARTSPVQEPQIANFHRNLRGFLHGG